eukprot:jgi/Ulvmu1/2847/UM145_0001.1
MPVAPAAHVMAAAACTLLLAGARGVTAQSTGMAQCSGGNAIGISIDGSGSVQSEFPTVTRQIAAFIDSTSKVDTPAGANSNLYYVNTFESFLQDTTGDFASNSGGAVSDAVLAFTVPGGSTNIGAGIDDLTAAYTRLTAPGERIAIVFTDGRDSSRLAEADALRAEGVTVAVVGIGRVDMPRLEDIASERADGSEIIFTGTNFDAIAELFSEVITSIDTDGDEVDNCNDGCPSDPNKTEPGDCGCGVPEGCDEEPEEDEPEREEADVDMRGMDMPDTGMPGTYGSYGM